MGALRYIIILLLGVVAGMLAWEVNAEPLRLAQHEVFPLASEALPKGGFACRIVSAALALSDRQMTINWYPSRRALMMVERGAADMSLGWRKTPEREQTVIFSDKPLIDSSILLFYRKDSPFDWDTIGDLHGLRFGYLIGRQSLPQEFLDAENAGELTVERVGVEEQNIRKLLAGRIDAIIGSPLSIPFILKARFSPEEVAQVAAHPKPLFEDGYYVVFSKQLSLRAIKDVNDGIQQLRENGQFDRWLSEALQKK